MKRTEIKTLLQNAEVGSKVNVKGWVRTKRGSKNVAFIALNDGSVIHNIQVVFDLSQFGEGLSQK
jgi:asparaginyl-tRNA synthetase